MSDSSSSALVCDISLPLEAGSESRPPTNVASWWGLTFKCCESSGPWQCMEGRLPNVWILFVPSSHTRKCSCSFKYRCDYICWGPYIFSLNRNAMCMMFSLKRKAQGLSASGYKMIPGSISGSKQVEYTSPRLIQQYHQCQCVSTGCWLLVIRTWHKLNKYSITPDSR